MNTLSQDLLEEIFSQQSGDPFLTLVTLTHPDFPTPIRFVNNSVSIVSNGNTFLPFTFYIGLPVDDGETQREFTLDFDNTSLELIDEIRSVVGEVQIDVKFEMVLASNPNVVEMSFEELKILNVTYNRTRISCRLGIEDFLNTELSSEKYQPTNFRGLFG